MKRIWHAVPLVALSAIVILLATCSPNPSVSITDRITSFVNSLNTDRSTTSSNLDPAIVAPTPSQWDSFFAVAYEPYSYSPSPVTSNPLDVETNIIGAGAAGWNYLYKFIMVDTGSGGSSNWMIHSLQISSGGGTWTNVF